MFRFLQKLIAAIKNMYIHKMSSTKNVKGNRQIVVATYTCEAVFKIPDGLDLEDENVVSSWGTKYGTLYISNVNSDETLKIESEWEPEID